MEELKIRGRNLKFERRIQKCREIFTLSGRNPKIAPVMQT